MGLSGPQTKNMAPFEDGVITKRFYIYAVGRRVQVIYVSGSMPYGWEAGQPNNCRLQRGMLCRVFEGCVCLNIPRVRAQLKQASVCCGGNNSPRVSPRVTQAFK